MRNIDRNKRCFKFSFVANLTALIIIGSILVFYVQDIDQQQNTLSIITNQSIDRQSCQTLCPEELHFPNIDRCCSSPDYTLCESKQQCKDDLIESMRQDISNKYTSFYLLFGMLGFFLLTLSLFICLNRVFIRRERQMQVRRNNQALEGLLFYVSHISQAVDRQRARRDSLLTESLITMQSEDNCCAVCLDGFQAGKAVVLSCNHIFHKECIGNWINLKTSCPVCRAPL